MPLAYHRKNGKRCHCSLTPRDTLPPHLCCWPNYVDGSATSHHSYAYVLSLALSQATKSPNCSTCKPSAKQPASADSHRQNRDHRSKIDQIIHRTGNPLDTWTLHLLHQTTQHFADHNRLAYLVGGLLATSCSENPVYAPNTPSADRQSTVRNQETISERRGIPRKAPLLVDELEQQYNGHK